MSRNRHFNDAGILATNTWRYYIQNFGCSHFKGRGIEDNIYLLRPLFWITEKEYAIERHFGKQKRQE